MRRVLVLLTLAAASPAGAWACSTCFDPKDQRQSNFLAPTIFMSLLPITMFGLIAAWLWRAHKQALATNVGPAAPGHAGAGHPS